MSAQAQVVLDGTLGRRGALAGPNYDIGADLGQQRGGNLFHSFHDFNLNLGESATFSGPNSVTNIISRVTGGNSSYINGTLRSTIPNADFYFLNPYGILFGEQAKLDVQGSFHASTADRLRLQDGGEFNARQPHNSLLTVAPVEAFGFLTNTPAAITLEKGRLSVAESKTLSFIGGDLRLNGPTPSYENPYEPTFSAGLSAKSGRINLASIASQSEVFPTDAGLELNAETQRGQIQTHNIKIDVSGESGGDIFIRGGHFELTNSQINAETLGDKDGGVIDIQADNLALQQGAQIFSGSYGNGKSGDIILKVTDALTVSGHNEAKKRWSSGIFSSSNKADTGNAGLIEIEANQLTLRDKGQIKIFPFGAGEKSGSIKINVNEELTITDLGSGIFSNFVGSKETSANKVGQIEIKARQITIESGTIGSTIMGDAAASAGDIIVEADNILLTKGAGISSTTSGVGKSGNIEVRATGTMTIEGANFIGLQSGIIASTQPLVTEGRIGGQGGNIRLEASELVIKDGGIINASTSTRFKETPSGTAGNIIIRVLGSVKLSGVNTYGENGNGLGTGIYVRSLGTLAGDAGTISLTAGSLSITEGAVITSSTTSHGQGGDITIDVDGPVSISGDSANFKLNEPAESQLWFRKYFPDYQERISISGIYASSENRSDNAGIAGNIAVSANTINVTEGGLINTATQNAGGGNITLTTPHLLYLRAGEITTSVKGGTGSGGDITISQPGFVVLDNGLIKAQAYEGRGGNIRILAKQFIPSYDSLVSASSRLGIDGEVMISSPEEDISGSFLNLTTDFFDASALLKKKCHLQDMNELSRFRIRTQREGMPMTPASFQE
jgi:filamentous hemagglutinin family protein